MLVLMALRQGVLRRKNTLGTITLDELVELIGITELLEEQSGSILEEG